MKREYVVFQGEEFTIEWYYNAIGKSQAKEYFDSKEKKRNL